MGLNDEIGNFSKRREVPKEPKEYISYDDNAYDDWDEEEDKSEPAISSYDFRMYKLDELDRFNKEVKEFDALIHPWWKNLKNIFSKTTLSKIGLIEYKKRHLFSDDTFDDVYLHDVAQSLDDLNTFEKTVKRSYGRRLLFGLLGLVLYVLLAYWTGWNVIWYFLLGWSLVKMGLDYVKHGKEQQWFKKARIFINAQDESVMEPENRNNRESEMEDVMAFTTFVSKEEKKEWSIKMYDAIENIFRRKK